MLLVHALAVVLHVVTGAAWFGLALRLGGQARAAASAEGPAGPLIAADGARLVRLLTAFLVLTLVFALAALFTNGGFETYGWPYHTSLTLLLVLLAVHLALVGPAWRALTRGLDGRAEGPGGGEAMAAARARVATGVGISHLLWLAILVLMFWNEKLAPALGAG